mgnify:CR=1 FL=1
MNHQKDEIRTLQDALERPCKHRDMDLALQPMDNFRKTPDGPNETPLAFWASWDLSDRPRRIALLLDDCQEEYRPFADEILPNLVRILNAFRGARDEHEGVCIAWSSWSRRFDDGISNAMDRWYGPRGLHPDNPENAAYIHTGAAGLKPLREIAPTQQEVSDGWHYHGKHLDMFWTFDEDGRSYLDEKLKQQHIDTIVITGLWTDECVLSTAYAGNARGYDVVVVNDAVATATANQKIALTIANSTVAKVLSTDQVVQYMEKDFVAGQPGEVKGNSHHDGRKS